MSQHGINVQTFKMAQTPDEARNAAYSLGINNNNNNYYYWKVLSDKIRSKRDCIKGTDTSWWAG